MGNVAVYFDFDNVHLSVAARQRHADSATRRGALVDVAAIITKCREYGPVTVRRAYGDWQHLAAYQHLMAAASVELTQVFGAGRHGKNGADIRLALDAHEDLYQLRDVTHVVVVSGDSDFTGLAEKVRRLGRTIVGIGVPGSTSQRWAAACDEFLDYITLTAEPTQHGEALDASLGLLHEAYRALTGELGARSVEAGDLRRRMGELDPDFDPTHLGFSRFVDYLEQLCGDEVDIRGRESGRVMVALGLDDALDDPDSEMAREERYRSALRRRWRLRTPETAGLVAVTAEALVAASVADVLVDRAGFIAEVADLHRVTSTEVRKALEVLARTEVVSGTADQYLCVAVDPGDILEQVEAQVVEMLADALGTSPDRSKVATMLGTGGDVSPQATCSTVSDGQMAVDVDPDAAPALPTRQ